MGWKEELCMKEKLFQRSVVILLNDRIRTRGKITNPIFYFVLLFCFRFWEMAWKQELRPTVQTPPRHHSRSGLNTNLWRCATTSYTALIHILECQEHCHWSCCNGSRKYSPIHEDTLDIQSWFCPQCRAPQISSKKDTRFITWPGNLEISISYIRTTEEQHYKRMVDEKQQRFC